MNLGWIGCGNMGVRMAERLVKAGNHLYVYNRTASKTERVLEAGDAVRLNCPAEVAEKSDLIFTSITNDAAMNDILYGDEGLLKTARPGQILVEMSTFSPEYSKELEQILHEKGILYLNAPVIGSMFMIEAGLLKIITSGDRTAYDTALPYFNAIGKTAVYMGDGAKARYMKIAVNMMICSYMTIYGEVLSAGEGMGFEWEELNDILEASEGASPMLKDKGTTHRDRIWGSETALTSTALKDLGLALTCAEKGGFALTITAIICQYDRFMHYNPKYTSYSSFGTIGVLENLAGKKPGDYPAVDAAIKDNLGRLLSETLTGITTLLAHETAAFCREAGIDRNLVLEILGTCHGASRFFKNAWHDIQSGSAAGNIALGSFRDSLVQVMDSAKNNGLFVPIMAAASQQLNSLVGKYGADADLLKIF